MALDRFLRQWTNALAGYEEASARFVAVTNEYLSLIGKPKHSGKGAQIFTEAEARVLAKQDYRRQKAISDQQFYAAEATMYGIAALVDMMRQD